MRNLLLALIGMTLLSGCIISHRDNDDADGWRSGDPGDIEFRWDFAGQSCATANPPVYKVQVRIQGQWGEELLRDGGLYDCRTGGVDGIRLLNFSGGTYNFSLYGLDANLEAIYSTSGTLYVDGTRVVNVTLNPTQTLGRVNVYWKFGPDAVSCDDAGIYVPLNETLAPGVTKVVAYMDEEQGTTLPCSQGGFSRDLSVGTHLLTLEGYISHAEMGGEQLWYKVTRTLIVQQGTNPNLTVVLDPVATVITVRPVLKNAGGSVADCTNAGALPIHRLAIQLTDWESRRFYEAPVQRSCTEYLNRGFTIPWVPVQFANPAWDNTYQCYTGTYTIDIDGLYCLSNECITVNEGVAQKKVYGGPIDQSFTVEMPPKS